MHSETDISKRLFGKLLKAVPRLEELAIGIGYLCDLQHIFKTLTLNPLHVETHMLPLLHTLFISCRVDNTWNRRRRRAVLGKLKAMAGSRAHLLADPPCAVTFMLSSTPYGDFESWGSDTDDTYFGRVDDMKALLGPTGVSKNRPYLTTTYYDSHSRPEGCPTLAQPNPGWTARPEAFCS